MPITRRNPTQPVAAAARSVYLLLMGPEEPRTAKKLLQCIQRQAGSSRRKAQELIESGEVEVNGRRTTDPFLVLPPHEIHHLHLRGYPLSVEPPKSRVYRYHKPVGMLCSHDDPHSGHTIGRVLRAEGFIGYTVVGRLDQDAEGLLLVTNDGALVQTFTHPRYEVPKVYHVWLQKVPKPAEMNRYLSRMKHGIVDAGDRLRIQEGGVVTRPTRVRVALGEGKKHEVKRLFAHFGLKVTRLQRTAIGPVELGRLPQGTFDRLDPRDTAALFDLARTTG